MAGKFYSLPFFERNAAQLTPNELQVVKGGYIEVPTPAGSIGGLNWSEIDVRDEEAPQFGDNVNIIKARP